MEEFFYCSGKVWRKVMGFREEVRGKLSGVDWGGVYEPRACGGRNAGDKAATPDRWLGDERDRCSLCLTAKSVHG